MNARYEKQLKIWRQIVGGLSYVSIGALETALDEWIDEQRERFGLDDIVEDTLIRESERLKAVV